MLDSYFIDVFREFMLLSFRTLEACVAHRMYLHILSVGVIFSMISLPKEMFVSYFVTGSLDLLQQNIIKHSIGRSNFQIVQL